MRTNAEQT
jgi:hypothetical protein